MNGRNPPQAYLNHVAMIESKIESATSPTHKRVQLPATIFNRSPLRERFGNSNSNANGNRSPSKKTGLSPLRSRRLENNGQAPSIIRMTSRQRDNAPSRQMARRGYCENHQNKPASFYVQSNSETGEYCEKCAILLASQGFKVCRIDDNFAPKLLTSGQNDGQLMIESPVRRTEINCLLEDLRRITQLIHGKKGQVDGELSSSNRFYQQQEKIINQYYTTLTVCLEEHRKKTIENLAFTKASSELPAVQLSQSLNQSLRECDDMRDDIFSSVRAINAVDEASFRPVMDTYKARAERLSREIGNVEHQPLNHPQLTTNDPRDVTRHLLKMVEIEFVESHPSQPSLREKTNSVYFSFENQHQMEQYSQPKQEMIETQDKHGQIPMLVSNGTGQVDC